MVGHPAVWCRRPRPMTSVGGEDRRKSEFRAIIGRLDRVDWDFRSFVPTQTAQGVNSLHWYPALFPSALAGTLLDILTVRNGVFLDPFSGAAVAPIEAWFRGMTAHGIDNNTFATRIGRAKIELLRHATDEVASRLADCFVSFQASARRTLVGEDPLQLCSVGGLNPDCVNWFDTDVIRQIVLIKRWLGSIEAKWSDVLAIVLSSLLHKVSILRDVHYTYIVDRSRTVRPPRAVADLEGDFGEKLLRVFRSALYTRLELLAAGCDLDTLPAPTLTTGRAQEVGALVPSAVDLVVTSPPYFGMNDYVRSQYLSWLVDGWPDYEADLASESGSRRDRRNPARLSEYLRAMDDAFAGLYKTINPGGWLALTLGQSRTALAEKTNVLDELHDVIVSKGFIPVWKKQRHVRFRKINNVRLPVEVVWVFAR